MPAFRYEAVDAQGKPRRGLLDAESSRQVRDQLRAQGLFPTAIDAATGAASGDGAGPRPMVDRLRLPAAQVALSTRQLATLVRSGMPLDQALAAVGEQADDARVAGVYTAARAQVAAGETLLGAAERMRDPRWCGDRRAPVAQRLGVGDAGRGTRDGVPACRAPGGPPKVVAGQLVTAGVSAAGVTVGYDRFAPDGLPRLVRLERSTPGDAVALDLSLSQLDTAVVAGRAGVPREHPPGVHRGSSRRDSAHRPVGPGAMSHATSCLRQDQPRPPGAEHPARRVPRHLDGVPVALPARPRHGGDAPGAAQGDGDDRAVPAGDANLCGTAVRTLWAACAGPASRRGCSVTSRSGSRLPRVWAAAARRGRRTLALGEALGTGRMTTRASGQAAAGVGADVAYFLVGGTALGTGRGDVLLPLPDQPRLRGRSSSSRPSASRRPRPTAGATSCRGPCRPGGWRPRAARAGMLSALPQRPGAAGGHPAPGDRETARRLGRWTRGWRGCRAAGRWSSACSTRPRGCAERCGGAAWPSSAAQDGRRLG